MRLHPNEIYIEVAFDLQVTLMALFAESHQIDYFSLTQASLGQLPGSSDVSNIGRSLFLITKESFRRSEGLKSLPINLPE